MASSVGKTRDFCYIGIFAALTAVLAQIIIPMPLGVPMTMQTFAIYLCGMLLGSRRAALAALVYVLMGAVGMPVYAGFAGGFGQLVSPSGGFLLSFPLMAFIVGLGAERPGSRLSVFWGMALGTAANFLCGMVLFSAVTSSGLWQAFLACVLPFLPTTVVKAAVAASVGAKLRTRGVLQH